jgi:nucleotide-binding universal stress UspA family protein
MYAPRKILVGTDFSASAERALDTALALAAPTLAEVHLIHALEMIAAPPSPYTVAIPEDVIRAAREGGRRKLDAAQRKVEARGLATSAVLGDVPAAPAIAARARELGADLVVVGSHGHTGLKRFLLGSVAEHTVKESTIPVLTVRGEGRAEAPRTIVVGTDFSAQAERAVAVAAEWARAFGAQLHLVHAIPFVPPLFAPYDVTVPGTLIDESYVAAGKKLAAIAEQLAGVDAHVSVLSAAPQDALDTIAKRVHADLIVTGSRDLRGVKHALLGSVAERTLRLAPCAVLTVKAQNHQLD